MSKLYFKFKFCNSSLNYNSNTFLVRLTVGKDCYTEVEPWLMALLVMVSHQSTMRGKIMWLCEVNIAA